VSSGAGCHRHRGRQGERERARRSRDIPKHWPTSLCSPPGSPKVTAVKPRPARRRTLPNAVAPVVMPHRATGCVGHEDVRTRRLGESRLDARWSVGVSGDSLCDREAQDDEDSREQDDRHHRDRERSPRVLVQLRMRHVRVRYMRMLQMTSRHPAPPPSLGRLRDTRRSTLDPSVTIASLRLCLAA
jgi:hypothetical protein